MYKAMYKAILSCLSVVTLSLPVLAEPGLTVNSFKMFPVFDKDAQPLSGQRLNLMHHGYAPPSYPFSVVTAVNDKTLFLNLVDKDAAMHVYSYPADLSSTTPTRILANNTYIAASAFANQTRLLGTTIIADDNNSTVRPYEFLKGTSLVIAADKEDAFTATSLPPSVYFRQDNNLDKTEGKMETVLAQYGDKSLVYFYRDIEFADLGATVCPHNGCMALSLSRKTPKGYQEPIPLEDHMDIPVFTFDRQLDYLFIKIFPGDYHTSYLHRINLNDARPAPVKVTINTGGITPVGIGRDGKTLGYFYGYGDMTCYAETPVTENYILQPDHCDIPVSGASNFYSGSMVYSEDFKFAVLPCGGYDNQCYSHLYSADHKTFWRVDDIKAIWQAFDNTHTIGFEKVSTLNMEPNRFRLYIRGKLKNSDSIWMAQADITVNDP